MQFDVRKRQIKTWKRVDEDTQDRQLRMQRVDEQILVDNGRVSTSSLMVMIAGTNMTLLDYYEDIRPPEPKETEISGIIA
jgi:hypothetical protein